MTNLILSYKGVNPNDKKVIINKLTGYFDLGNIFSGNTHRNAFTPALAILQTVEQSMLKSGLDGSAVFIAEARTQLESTYAQLYREAMADGTMHFSDTQHITTELNKFARTLVSPEAIATLGSGDDVGNLMTTLGFGKTEGGTPTVDTSGDPTPTVETPEELEAEKIEEQDKALQEKLEVIFHTQNEPALPNLHKLSKSYQEAEKALEGVPEEKREELIKQYAEEALEAIAVEMDYNKFGGWSGKRDNKQLETLVKEIGKDPKSAFTKDVREILDNLERNTKELDRLNNKSGG
jgi:ribosomal protein L22